MASFDSLVATSSRVAGSASRLAKISALAECLAGMSTTEIEILTKVLYPNDELLRGKRRPLRRGCRSLTLTLQSGASPPPQVLDLPRFALRSLRSCLGRQPPRSRTSWYACWLESCARVRWMA